MKTLFCILERIRPVKRLRHHATALTKDNLANAAADSSDRLFVLLLRSPNDQLQIVVLKARHLDLRP